jgi:thiamine kinase
MSDHLNAFEALALVPGWDPAVSDVEELKGGLTNRTYRVQRGDNDYVLRLNSKQSGVLQFDRSYELAILQQAGEAGLAPEIIFADSNLGILITTFLQGRTWDESDLKLPHQLEALAEIVRKVHALPLSGLRVDMSAAAVTYETYLEKRHGLHSFATRCVEIIDEVTVRDGAACCHNDIVGANIIEGSVLMLIDWEYACDNDPMFDLASVIGFHNLDEKSSSILLDAYAGGKDQLLSERLSEQIRVYDAIQWLWLATRHLVFPSRAQARRLEELQQRIR